MYKNFLERYKKHQLELVTPQEYFTGSGVLIFDETALVVHRIELEIQRNIGFYFTIGCVLISALIGTCYAQSYYITSLTVTSMLIFSLLAKALFWARHYFHFRTRAEKLEETRLKIMDMYVTDVEYVHGM